jgi:hypothetical protein
MGKRKRKNRHGPAELLVVEAEEFPTAVIVELWGRNAKGKREFLDSRRYDTGDDPDEGEPADGAD